MIAGPANDPATGNRVARCTAAGIAIRYGCAKLTGSRLDRPMGMVSGFRLTRFFFGDSSICGGVGHRLVRQSPAGCAGTRER